MKDQQLLKGQGYNTVIIATSIEKPIDRKCINDSLSMKIFDDNLFSIEANV